MTSFAVWAATAASTATTAVWETDPRNSQWVAFSVVCVLLTILCVAAVGQSAAKAKRSDPAKPARWNETWDVVMFCIVGLVILFPIAFVLVGPAGPDTASVDGHTYTRSDDIGADSSARMRVTGKANLWTGDDGSVWVGVDGDGRTVTATEIETALPPVAGCEDLGCVDKSLHLEHPDITGTIVTGGGLFSNGSTLIKVFGKDGEATICWPFKVGDTWHLITQDDLDKAYQAALNHHDGN